MSSDRPVIRLRRPLRSVSAGAAPAPPQHTPTPGLEKLEELRRNLTAEQERSAQAEAELARHESNLAESQRTLDAQLARLADLIAGVEQERTALLRANEEEIVAFSLSITEKVLQHEIENGRYKIGEVVAATLRAVRDKGAVVVRVNPRDLELTRQALQTMRDPAESDRVSAVADESLPLASCCIESDSGKVFSEIPERLRRIERSLLKRNG